MDRESLYGQMEVNMRETLIITLYKAKENTSGLIKDNMKVIG